jgi:shikimate kinase
VSASQARHAVVAVGGGSVVAEEWNMEQLEDRAFDGVGFLDLLADVTRDRATGVVSARIHIRDGLPRAMAVEFEKTGARAA